MREAPLVSVIVSAYNTEKYIEKCLESLRTQTYPNLEILVIDDGSTDGTQTVCDRYAAADSRFRVLHTENFGVSAGRNLGIDLARGKYLVFADSDDYAKPDYVQTLAQEAEAEAVQLVCGEFFWVYDGNEDAHASLLSPDEKRFLSAREAIELLPDKRSFQGYVWGRLFLTEIVQKAHLRFDPKIKIWEDELFFLQYLTKIQRVSYLGKPIYGYVQRQGSAQQSAQAEGECTHVNALAQIWEIVQPMKGPYHDYVRDSYALNLVALLGKPGFRKGPTVKAILLEVDALHGTLPKAHCFKKLLFQYGGPITGMIWKVKKGDHP